MPLQAEGEFARVKEKLEGSLVLSGQPVKRGTMAHMHIVYMMLVDTAAKARDAETIRKYAPLLEELAKRDQHQPYLAISLRGKGTAHRLGLEFEQAELCLNQALEIFESLEMKWQAGRTLFELGELAMQNGLHALSQERFASALENFEKLKAAPDVERAAAALAEIRALE